MNILERPVSYLSPRNHYCPNNTSNDCRRVYCFQDMYYVIVPVGTEALDILVVIRGQLLRSFKAKLSPNQTGAPAFDDIDFIKKSKGTAESIFGAVGIIAYFDIAARFIHHNSEVCVKYA
jgi:hypothetical protein